MKLFFGSLIALVLLLLAHRRYKANGSYNTGATLDTFEGIPDEHPLDPNDVEENPYPLFPEDIELEKVATWLGSDIRDLPVEFLLDRPESDDHPHGRIGPDGVSWAYSPAHHRPRPTPPRPRDIQEFHGTGCRCFGKCPGT
jgi:hypothetical protein